MQGVIYFLLLALPCHSCHKTSDIGVIKVDVVVKVA